MPLNVPRLGLGGSFGPFLHGERLVSNGSSTHYIEVCIFQHIHNVYIESCTVYLQSTEPGLNLSPSVSGSFGQPRSRNGLEEFRTLRQSRGRLVSA